MFNQGLGVRAIPAVRVAWLASRGAVMLLLAMFSMGAVAQTHTVGGAVNGLGANGLVLTMNYSAPACLADDSVITIQSTHTSDCFLPSVVNQCCSQSVKLAVISSFTTVSCTCGVVIIPRPVPLGSTLPLTQTVTIAGGATGYQFPGPLVTGANYSVAITSQPINPLQSCTLVNDSGSVANANVNNVNVSCVNALTSGIRDLTLDAAFNGGNYDTVDITTTGHTSDRGISVVASDAGGYWLIGSTTANDNFHATPVITQVSTTGVTGIPTLYPANTQLSSLNQIAAATKAVGVGGSRIYVIGSYNVSAFADDDFGVVCLDPANAFLACSGFGSGGLSHFAFDRGGSNDDDPTAIAYDDASGDIFVAGQVDVGGHDAIGVVRLNGTSGAVVTSWGNAATANGTFIYSASYVSGGSTYPLAITVGSPRPAVRDAFVVGYATANASGTDTDGVVLPIDTASGHAFDAGWNFGFAFRIFFDLGVSNKTDVISAVALRQNGNLLIAGHADGDAGLSRAIVGEFDSTGTPRAEFCGTAAICNRILGNQPIPMAIAERPGLGNVVVSAGNMTSTGVNIQSVYQLDHQGAAVTAIGETGYFSVGVNTPPYSQAAGILVDDRNNVLQAGYRIWNQTTNDYDMTIRRWYPADSIFASGFAGAFAD